MVYFQQSLFGKMSWERFHQMTGWILEPSYPLSQTPMFQCLLLVSERCFRPLLGGRPHTEALKGSGDWYAPPCFNKRASISAGGGQPAISAKCRK